MTFMAKMPVVLGLASAAFFILALGFGLPWSYFQGAFGALVLLLLFGPRAGDAHQVGAREAPPAAPRKPVGRLSAARELVGRYGEVLERSPGHAMPQSWLPASKNDIKDALVLMALAEGGIHGPGDLIQALQSGYARLAYFVPDEQAAAASDWNKLFATFSADMGDEDLLRLAQGIKATSGVGIEVSERTTREFGALGHEFEARLRGLA